MVGITKEYFLSIAGFDHISLLSGWVGEEGNCLMSLESSDLVCCSCPMQSRGNLLSFMWRTMCLCLLG